MAESCVKEIKFPNLKLESFIREVEEHGEILTLSELYARDQKLGNEIILGVVNTVCPFIKKRDRQLQVILLSEVTVECHTGLLFRVCAFNKFATSLADACLHKGDFAAFCSPCIWESPQYCIEKGCHHLAACIGIPEQPSTKIFFARKPHITNAGTSKQQGSRTICKSLGVSLERHETPNKVSRGTSPSSTETFHNSTLISPVPTILSNTARLSPVPPSILPCTSSSRDKQIQHALDDSAVVLQSTQNKYTYKKISDLVEPEKKVNIYGVIHTILKMPKKDNKHAIVRLRDETCGLDEDFRVHIFFSHETAFPKLERGYILRLHRLKTELFEGVLDGRVFRATDVVTFPPDGQGIANAFATSKCFHFTASDTDRLTELRKWIASQKQQQPLPPVPVTSNTTLVPPVLSSEPNRTLLNEIKKEGNYILHCKVLDVNIQSDEMRFFTVTDGTSFIYSTHLDEDEKHATHKVRIMVLDPSPLLKKIRRGSLVELTNVTVQLVAATALSQGNWLYASLKVNGNTCNVKIFKGVESEAVKLKRQLQDARLRDQQQSTDFLDQLITELISESPHQSNSDNIVQVADTVTHSSVQTDCQQSEKTAHLFKYNSNPVQQDVVSSDGETMVEVESLASEILSASEVDDLDSSDKFSALRQTHLRKTGISNYHEAESLVISDVSSDASALIIDNHDSMSTRVQRSCEGGGSSDSMVVACTDEDMECHSAELHSSTIGYKQKFASGIISGVQGIPADISHIKRTRVQSGEQQVYLLKAWVKDIEPPITRGSKMNIVSGFCDYCKSTCSYEALKMRHKNCLLCHYCFQKGRKMPVVLEYLLRLHLIDENGDELIVTVAANHGVELLGCTVNAYLYDSMANRRVVKMLTDLIAESSGVLLLDQGPMLKLMVTPVHTSMGTEYIVHSTYLCTTHNSEEQRN